MVGTKADMMRTMRKDHPNCVPFYRSHMACLMLPHGHHGSTTAPPRITATVAAPKGSERTVFALLVQSFAKLGHLN